MADLNLIRGGAPVPQYPACDSSVYFDKPYAKTVARVFHTGRFTMGNTFEPSAIRPQLDAMVNAGLGENEHVYLVAVPSEHIIQNLQFSVRRGDPRMIGATVKAYMAVDTGNSVNAMALDDLPMVSLTTDSVNYQQFDKPIYIPTGSTMLIGFSVTALPSQPNVKLQQFTGKIQVACNVDGLGIPDVL